MKYTEYADKVFRSLIADSPANNCLVYQNPGQIILDAGVKTPGGWTSAKKLLNGLIGGRGMAEFGSELVDGQRLSTVRMFLDDPVQTYERAFTQQDGFYGVKEGDRYVLGFSEQEDLNVCLNGNFVIGGPCSLIASVFFAARPVSFALDALYAKGIQKQNIQWAWSSCPVAILSYDQQMVYASRETMLRKYGVTGIWLRGEDAQLSKIAAEYDKGELRLHNLLSGKTWVNEQK